MSHKQKTKAQLVDELAQMRRQMLELEALSRAGAILGSSLNYAAVLDCILEQMGRVVSHDAACIMLVEGEIARIFRWQGYAGFGSQNFFARFTFKIADTPCLRMARNSGQPSIISIAENEPSSIYGLEQTWIKSHLTAPISFRERLVGFLNVDSATPDCFNQADGERLQTFATAAANALKNAELYDRARQEIVDRVAALKKERNFVAAVLETAGALVMVLNSQGRILRFNRACEQTTGYSLDEVRGKYFWDLFVTSNQVESVKAIFRALRAGQRQNKYEGRWWTKDRRERLIAWSNTVLLDNRGVVEYIISTGIDITERRQLEERLEAIHYMGRELNLLHDEVAILKMTLETAAFLLRFRSAGYGLVDEATGQLNYYYYPVRGASKKLEVGLPLDTGNRIDELASRYEQIISAAADPEETLPVLALAEQAGSWLSVPMKVSDRVIGVLDVEIQQPDQFSVTDHQLLQTLADQTAVAIENARLHYEAQKQVDELATMSMVSQTITSTLDLEGTLTGIANHTVRLLEAMAASVVFQDEERGDLWFYTASGQASDVVRGMRLSAGKGIVGWVIEHGEPALVPDVTQDPRFFGDFDQQTGFTTRSIICVPLQTGEQTIGAIEVMNKQIGSFSQKDLRLLSWLATPAAIAIQNARLFQQVQIGHQRLQSLSRRLVEVQETERHHIARELHDEAGQALTSLMVGLRLLEREANSSQTVVAQVAELKRTTNDILENLHRLAINLRPASLDHLGLVAALRQYIKNFDQQHDNLTVQFEMIGLGDGRLPPAVETNLYRIVQEALTNVVRHAQATRIAVLLERRGDQMLTIVEDNGVGFDPQAAEQNSRLGLLGMRERAEMLGGTLVIESTIGTGTTIYVEVPYVHTHSDSR
ncbi:MAG: GAF domain-containing protein [Anaerolineae bacterium]|nr:GAF domain-containing protein [Anaerolineae bacterium]